MFLILLKYFLVQVSKMTPAPGVMIVAVLSLGYLCSSDIFALINYVGFATWISIGSGVVHSDWSRNVEARLSLVERIIVLLRQLSYAIKNQLVASKAPY